MNSADPTRLEQSDASRATRAQALRTGQVGAKTAIPTSQDGFHVATAPPPIVADPRAADARAGEATSEPHLVLPVRPPEAPAVAPPPPPRVPIVPPAPDKLPAPRRETNPAHDAPGARPPTLPPTLPSPTPTPTPTPTTLPPAPSATPGAHSPPHALLADTELVDDARGGYRFRDPADDARHGVSADQGRHAPPLHEAPPPGKPAPTDKDADARRLAFPGDAQFPPQSHPGSGTQGTWDDSLLPDEQHPGLRSPW